MTTFTIVNLIGWTSYLISFVVRWYLTKKEDKIQLQLYERITKMDELSIEGKVQLSFDIEDHKIKRFGPMGSYGLSLQILTFGIGVFITSLIFQIFN
jgi:predicted nuclease of restriction endonuclease-like (RecB) superfamily